MVATVQTACDLQHYAVSTMQYSYQLLPSVTIIYARGADTIGAFGLVYIVLPILTRFVHVAARSIRLVWILLPADYHRLPFFTGPPIWLCPAHETPLPAPPPPMVIEDIHTHIDDSE